MSQTENVSSSKSLKVNAKKSDSFLDENSLISGFIQRVLIYCCCNDGFILFATVNKSSLRLAKRFLQSNLNKRRLWCKSLVNPLRNQFHVRQRQLQRPVIADRESIEAVRHCPLDNYLFWLLDHTHNTDSH